MIHWSQNWFSHAVQGHDLVEKQSGFFWTRLWLKETFTNMAHHGTFKRNFNILMNHATPACKIVNKDLLAIVRMQKLGLYLKDLWQTETRHVLKKPVTLS